MITPETKLIIFDLDDTLCDTSSTSRAAKLAMIEAMIAAGLPKEAYDMEINDYDHLSGKQFIIEVCNRYGCLSSKITERGIDAYYRFRSNMTLYPGALDVLRRLPQRKVLLTTGIPEIQKAKIDEMFIGMFFERIIYDDIHEPDKEKSIRELMEHYGYKGDQIIAIGDKISDIIAANKAGVISVRKLSGRFKDIPYSDDIEKPRFTITDLRELL